MTTLPLGIGAYKRQFAGEVDIQLVNRFVEKNPSNLEEQIALLARPGNHFLESFSGGRVRANITKRGLFSGDLFVVAGHNMYRYDGTTKTLLIGEIDGTDAPRHAWMKGEGYEYLFISDGTHLFYYKGAGNATGVLTYDGSGSFVTDVIIINGIYYSWGSNVTDPLADGTILHPFVAKANANPLADMANMLEFNGVPGVDFSDTLTTPNVTVSSVGDATTLTLTARVEGAAGNAITTVVQQKAVGIFKITAGGIANNETVTVGTKTGPAPAVYTFKTAPPANPFEVLIGGTLDQSINNLLAALTLGAGAGTLYGTGTTANLDVVATAIVGDPNALLATAITAGTAGNSVATTETCAHATWTAATLTGGASGNLSFAAATLLGGGTHSLHQVPVPGAVNILALTALAGHVLVAVGGTQKCFYIKPGEHVVGALDFFEKEQNPDPVVDLATVGDVAVIAGEGSTEYWSATGDDANPFAPIQGRANARGIVPGTLVVVDDTSYIAVGNDLKVYMFSPSPTPISDNGIEERIRTQLRREASL